MAPKYLVNGTGISQPKSLPVKSNKIIIIEGMATIYDEVSDIFDINIYIDLDDDIRKERFLNRAKSRNQDGENALKHWQYVQTAGKKYVASKKDKSDIIINGECDLNYFSEMIKFIYLITNDFTENQK